jgi:hypothetical protein
MTGLNGAGHHTGNGHKPPPVTPLRVDPAAIAGWPQPPCDMELEQALLGAVMTNNAACPGFLRPEHFSLRVHQDIFEAIGALISRGEVADHVTLKHYFELDPALLGFDGTYLTELERFHGGMVRYAESYARTIFDLWQRREIMAVAQELNATCAHPTAATSAADNVVWLRDRIDKIAKGAPARHSRKDILARVSFTSWFNRDIAPLDRLLGDMLTTTTRMMLVAPTGLGKTNIALAKAVAVALGRDFLHWRGAGRPRRVLYVDGEMSQRLMKQRIIDAARRAGMGEVSAEDLATLQANLFVLNHADFPDLAPLNTAAGQQFIDGVIEQLGGIDLLVIDNIQALTVGDPLDPAEWQQVLPWAKQLTNRQIGQLWIHHTGHDETHAYGPKTREWQFDTIAMLERVERPEAALAFKIHFRIKKRECTPENRSDFDEAIVTLSDDTWSSERGGQSPGKRSVPDRVFELLQDAIARHGESPPENGYTPPNTSCVKEALWRRFCEMGCISDGDPDPGKKAEADRKAFKRAAQRLLDRGLIGKCNGSPALPLPGMAAPHRAPYPTTAASLQRSRKSSAASPTIWNWPGWPGRTA